MSSKINLPFRPEFKDKMLSGRKICSSRTSRLGKEGDTFNAFGAEFVIEQVDIADKYGFTLFDVATILHREEGFDNSLDFIECWQKIHPRVGYRPEQKVFVHWFRKVKE